MKPFMHTLPAGTNESLTPRFSAGTKDCIVPRFSAGTEDCIAPRFSAGTEDCIAPRFSAGLKDLPNEDFSPKQIDSLPDLKILGLLNVMFWAEALLIINHLNPRPEDRGNSARGNSETLGNSVNCLIP
jgi:hypothetical protein